ncbi:MAG: hypothetical protein ACREVB_17565, partial [Burkholderiales bacterium]
MRRIDQRIATVDGKIQTAERRFAQAVTRMAREDDRLIVSRVPAAWQPMVQAILTGRRSVAEAIGRGDLDLEAGQAILEHLPNTISDVLAKT